MVPYSRAPKSGVDNLVYVIGHVNPDTDAIASAMGYAWLLKERDEVNAKPARSGVINRQTVWVLRTLLSTQFTWGLIWTF